MVKEDLVEGLKLAVSKGEPLEKAMATFYNSGYKKEDIEEAAAAMAQPFYAQVAALTQPKPVQTTAQPAQNSQPSQQTQGSQLQQIKPLIPQQPVVVQRVSDYNKKPKKTSSLITIVLIVLLFLLLGVLATLFIFKTQISSLLGGFWRVFF